jgi:hypothetical protein
LAGAFFPEKNGGSQFGVSYRKEAEGLFGNALHHQAKYNDLRMTGKANCDN